MDVLCPAAGSPDASDLMHGEDLKWIPSALLTTAATALIITGTSNAQSSGTSEIQLAQFLIGTWHCSHTVGDFSGIYTTTYANTLGGRWIKQIYEFPPSEGRPAVEGEFLIGYDERNGRWLRTGAMSDGLYFSMVGKRDGDSWHYGYVLPGTSGNAVYTKKSDREYTVDGPTYPENGKPVTEHHRCMKT
jgi:hypothetical protein